MKYKYQLAFMLLVLGGCLYLFTAFYEEAKKRAIDDLNAGQFMHARQAAEGIENTFNYYINILASLSRYSHIVNLDESGKELLQETFNQNRDAVSIMSRIDRTGRISYALPYDEKVIGADLSPMDHVKKLLDTKELVVSDVYRTLRDFEAIALHMPIVRQGQFDGSVALIIPFDVIAKKYLATIKIGESGYAWVVSEKGIELYCPVPGHVGNSVFENCRDFPSIIAMAGEMLQGKEGITTYQYDRIRGGVVEPATKHAVFMPIRIGNTFWSIVVATPEDEVLSIMKGFRNRLILIFGILVLGTSLFSYYGMKAWGIVQEEEKRRRAEKERAEYELRLASIINFQPDATLAIDREGQVIAWNRAIEDMTGVKAEEMLGKGNYEYAIPFYGKRRPILIDFVFSWDREIEKQYSFISKEADTLFTETAVPFVRGQSRILWAKASPLYDTEGNIVGAIESIRDVTERKHSEEALKVSEEKYRTILEEMEEGYQEVDLSGNFTFFNESFRRIFGYTREELMGSNFRQYAADERMADKVYEAYNEMYRTGTPLRPYEWDILTKEGTRRTVEFSASLLRDSEGHRRGFRGIVRDVTDRKFVEEQYRVIANSSPVGVYIIQDGRICFANRQIPAYSGYSEEELLGSRILGFVHPDDRESVRNNARKMLRGEISSPYEYRILEKQGKIKWLIETVVPISFRGSQAVLGNTMDITEQKEAEEKKARLQEQLIKSQKMEAIGTLAGGIAHDFNNLLTGIQGHISMMTLGMEPGHPYCERLKQIEDHVMSGANLTRQLLGFAQGSRYEMKPTDMNEVIEKTASMFGRTKKEILFCRNYENSLWMVDIDRGQMEQVFMNFFVNAWQAMPGGGEITLTSKNVMLNENDARVYLIEPGRYVKISVTDTGAGMDEKTRERIFEPFFTTKGLGKRYRSWPFHRVWDHQRPQGTHSCGKHPGPGIDIHPLFACISSEERCSGKICIRPFDER